MPRCFKQLNFNDRLTIYQLLNKKISRTGIARALGVHRSTLTRELNRNWWRSNRLMLCYTPSLAQEMTKARKQRPLKLKRGLNEYLKEFIIELLQKT